MWDYQINADSLLDYKDLINSMIKGMAKKQDIENLIKGLKSNPGIANSWGLSPEFVPYLIDCYPEVAYELFITMNGSPEIAK